MELSKPRRRSAIEARSELPFEPPQPGSTEAAPATNFAALLEGRFPERLLERAEAPDAPTPELMDALRERHTGLLEGRPLPELLEGAALVQPPEELRLPTLGETSDERLAAEQHEPQRLTPAGPNRRPEKPARGRDGRTC